MSTALEPVEPQNCVRCGKPVLDEPTDSHRACWLEDLQELTLRLTRELAALRRTATRLVYVGSPRSKLARRIAYSATAHLKEWTAKTGTHDPDETGEER